MKSKYRTFGLSTLLAVIAVVAATLVGYRSGFKSGIIDREAATVSTQSYYVAPLVIVEGGDPGHSVGYDKLITLITSTVSSDSWGNGGGSIKVDLLNRSLQVSQTARVHSELDCFFDMFDQINSLQLSQYVKTVSTQSYYVAPLVIVEGGDPGHSAGYDKLITLITSTVSSGSWGNGGGSIKVDLLNRSLQVSQTARVHSELDCFFDMFDQINSLQLSQYVKLVDKQLKAARDDAEELAIAGDFSHAKRVLAEAMKKIGNGMIQLTELASDLARSEVALKSGREACLEQVWLLESGTGSRLVTGNSEESNTEGAKIEDMTPEQIIQQHIVEVKKQIEDLGSALPSDLAVYFSNYEKMVKSEAAMARVQKLASQKEKLIQGLDYGDRAIGPPVGRSASSRYYNK